MLVPGAALVVLTGLFPPDAVVRRDARGTVRWAQAPDLAAAVADEPSVRAARDAGDVGRYVLAVLAACRDALALASPADELRVQAVESDGDERRVRLGQVYRDVPVEAAELSVHVDAARRVRLVSGRYVPTPAGVDVTPTIDAAAAERRAGATPAGGGAPTRLVLYAPDAGDVKLAYRVALQRGLVQREVVYVDAHDGAVLGRVASAYPLEGGNGGVAGP